ncbi:SusC/RagA family TonB-linked outer membrane protein [Arcticibacter svalbardensis]|nr:TonB-dependent receptor [Arcticibacter svalbardensis]
MNRILRCFCLLIYLGVPGVIYAQKTVIKGKIVAENDLLPLPGATVSVKNKPINAIADVDGNFTITTTSPLDVLQIRFVGFISQEISIQGKKQITVILANNQTILDQVVVIGYGSEKRSDLTGAIGSVNVEDFKKASVSSVEEALAGRVAGVQVNAADGQPGSPLNIIIRGVSSLTQETSPLYVIDGFPVEDFNNNLLNPADIESIEVLKDASATAIYGSRGGNGVIIVTTKKGAAGLPKISYDFYTGFQNEVKRYELMNAYEFVKYQIELNPATTRYTTDIGKTLDAYKDVQGIDWQDEAMQMGKLQSHSLSLSGGDKNTKYVVSGSYFDQKGLLLNSGFKRYQGRIVLDQTVNKNLKVGVNLNMASTEKFGAVANSSGDNGSSTLNVMYSIWGYRPVAGGSEENEDILLEDPTDPDVNAASDYRFNPVLSLKNEYNLAFNNSLLGNAYAEYKFSKNLTLRSTMGITKGWYKQEIFNNTNTRDGSPSTPQGANGMNGSFVHSESLNFLNENTITYKKTIKKHSLNLLAGYTFQKYKAAVDGFSANQVPNADLGNSGLDEGVPDRIRASSTLNGLESYLTRISYNYNFKYYLTASFRGDGSSKFSKGNKWAYFPSTSFAWRISKENFFKPYLKIIEDAKLRIGYGSTGNNRVSDFAYRSSLFVSGYGYGFNNGAIPATYPQALGNYDIKWESSNMLNAGFDLSFLNGKINLTADVYKKNTTDLLLNASLNPSSGYSNAFKNIGEISNEGVELTLNTVNIKKKDFSWTSNFNISFNKNRVVSLNEDQAALLTSVGWSSNYNNTTPYIAKPGKSVALFYGFIFDGIYQYEDFNNTSSGGYQLKDGIPNNGAAASTIQPGDIKYKDINGDGLVNSDDRTIIGDPNPIHIGGFSNNFTYKGFDLNVFLQWSYGNEILNANRLEFEGGSARTSLNQFATFQDRWTPTNPSNEYFRARGQGPSVYSSKIVEDGSYLRLKTVALGYIIPDKLSKRLKMSRLRIYASMQNIATWTNYSGIDPDVSVRASALTPGFDWSAYPSAKTFTFGLNLNF